MFYLERKNMKRLEIITLFFFQLFNLIYGKDCTMSQNDSTSIICSENPLIIENLTYYLSNFSSITQLSLINSYLTEMPDLYHNNTQLITILHLDNNQIQLLNRNYSNIEYLYLTSNHIYALHLTNLSYPHLKYLDLSDNPIEHITENFFSNQQFPQLKILKLTNALRHINPYIIDNRLVSFSSLKYLNEIYFDDNDLEEFSCSINHSHIQWILPTNLQKLVLGKNKLQTFDELCFLQIFNLIELDLHYNYLKNFSKININFPYLTKLQLDYNLFTNIPSNFLHLSKQLIELNLSENQLNFKKLKRNKQSMFPSTLKILYLNAIETDLSCLLFENLIELEELHIEKLISIGLESCIFKKLTKLKMLNLRSHRLKTIDEQIFRPLLTMDQFDTLDLTSHSLLCDSCSLRWLIDFSKSTNKTKITCLDQYGKEVFMNSLDLPACLSLHMFPTMLIIILSSISLLLLMILCCYIYQQRKISYTKFSSSYHMIPLRNYDRIRQTATEDITNDNVMLVT